MRVHAGGRTLSRPAQLLHVAGANHDLLLFRSPVSLRREILIKSRYAGQFVGAQLPSWTITFQVREARPERAGFLSSSQVSLQKVIFGDV